MDPVATREELHRLLVDRSLRFGDFVLASGRRSDLYVNCKEVTLDGRGLHLLSRMVLDRCRELRVAAIGGLTLGADPIAAGVAALSGQEGAPLRAFIVRKQSKQHGTAALIEGPALRRGDRVMVVDDVITTGASLLQAVDALDGVGGVEIVEALAIVDREEGGRQAIEARGITVRALFTRSEFPGAARPA